MKIIGDGSIQFFDDEVEGPHQPDHQTLWQESFAHYFWDHERQVYAFLRLSQVPNRVGASASAFLNIWTPDGFYKHTDDKLLLDTRKRTSTSLAVGNGLCKYELVDGKFHWTIDDRKFGLSAELVFEGFHKGVNYFAADAAMVKETVPNHTQATGWTTGAVNIGAKEYNIDGIAWRDHSWGVRRWLSIRAHRFAPAIFGKSKMFSNVAMIASDGKLTKFGIFIEGDTAQFVDDFDIISYVGEDATSTCGAHVDLRKDGRTYPIEFEPLGPSSVIMTDGLAYVELPCRVKLAGETGFGWLETSHHAQGGEDVPAVYPPGVIENGFHPTRPRR